jgi:hypothetical protein
MDRTSYCRACIYVFLFIFNQCAPSYEKVWIDLGHTCVSVHQSLNEGYTEAKVNSDNKKM